MNRIRRWQTIQRAALLFTLALGGWLAFQCILHTSFAMVPGVITAVLLATVGSGVVRYLDETREVRPVNAPVQRPVRQQVWVGHRRVVTAHPPSPVRHWHRPAA